ncbi:MAG: DUF6293 family protein [Nitrososphaeraceae archaeon]|nr:DUF6293 family protein [Nitrososphaeraceae archaeon]
MNVSTGSKIVSIVGMLSCMIWRAIPYYVHLAYKTSDKLDTNHNFKDETVSDIIDIPVYKITSPKIDSLKILDILLKNNGKVKKKKLIEQLEEERLMIVYRKQPNTVD